MKILKTKDDLKEAIINCKNLGFVPTMGSLHKGHISIIKNSQKKSNKTIVSIFVNPTQFNKKEDFKTYPRNIAQDIQILKRLKVDFVFLPKVKDIYNNRIISKFKIKSREKILCANNRKGHFEGVLEVMNRLLNLIKPKFLFMGEKDFQQQYLINKYLQKKHLFKLIICKTIRYKKMALSSRNLNLQKKSLIKVQRIAQELFLIKNKYKHRKFRLKNNKNSLIKYLENKYLIKIDYLDFRNINNLNRSKFNTKFKLFIAYYIDNIRLIDNF
tara:strand:- start:3647 stop:4459 length:813 start_codon:yes stop_codon:yes gene_type:complete